MHDVGHKSSGLKCSNIRIVSRDIGDSTFANVNVCKIVKRGRPSRELYAVKTFYVAQMRRSQCAVFGPHDKVKVRSGMYQLNREIGILRELKGSSSHIVDLEFVVGMNNSAILMFTKYAGSPIMQFCTENLFYSALVDDGLFRKRQTPSNPSTLFEEDVCMCLFQLLEAVSFVHAAGIVHKDIKPDNILLRVPLSRWRCDGNSFANDDRQPIHLTLCDFNMSERGGPTIYDAQGTTLFTPPECFTSKKKGINGFARDIWSVGILAHCLLLGRPPIVFMEPIRIQFALIGLQAPPELLNATPKLEKFVRSLLDLKPKKRPSARNAMLNIESILLA